MSRYRTIHCLIWNDDKFPFLPDDAQLVFLHLLTTPLSNQLGCFKAGISSLAEEKRWTAERYRKSFQILLDDGFIKYDEKYLVIYVNNFLKYNTPHNPNVLKSWAQTFNELPNCNLKTLLYQQLKSLSESLGESYIKSLNESFKSDYRIQEQEQEQEENKTTNVVLQKKSKSKNHPMPSDFSYNEKHKQLAAKYGLNVQEEFEKFKDRNEAKGETYSNWNGAFSYWLRNAPNFARAGPKTALPDNDKLIL